MASDPNTDLSTQPPSNDAPTGTTDAVASSPVSPADHLQRHAADILARVADAYLVLDSDWRIVYANQQACRINQKALEEFVGRTHWEEWPASVGTEVERQYRRAMEEQVDVHFQHRYAAAPYDVWLEIDAYPVEGGLSLFYREISARKRAEEALRDSEERYRLLVEGAHDYAMILMDSGGRIASWNLGAERTLGWTEAEVLGQSADLIFTPEDRAAGVPARELDTAGVQGRVIDLRWHLRKDGSRFFADGVLEALRDEHGEPRGFAKILRDVTEARQAQDTLHASEERFRDAQARLEAALEAGGIATWTWDLASSRIVADASLARLFSLSAEDAADGQSDVYLQRIHPEDRLRVSLAIEDAVTQQGVYEVEHRIVLPDGALRWLAARGRVDWDVEGRPVALRGVVVDITEQAERRQREQFLVGLMDRARGLTDPDEVVADVVRSVGEFLGVGRCVFGDIDMVTDTCTIIADYCSNHSMASIVGTFPFSEFGPFVVAEYQAGRAVAVDDVRLDRVRVTEANVATYEAIGIRAHITAPVVHSARLVSVIAVHSSAPRHWKPEEVALLQTVVERTWLTVEVARQQRALVREAEERHAAHERTSRILESVTDAFFALDTDWRFTYVNRQAEALWGRTRADLLGRNVWDEFPEAVGSTFDRQFHYALSEGVSVPFEEFYPPLNAWLDVRVYPSSDGLSVFFQNVNERKAAESERDRLAKRERNIATQLQEALQPDLPGAVPGLALTKYYEAALAESEGVGGDFYDVFAVEKGCTALVVGDLSGKGLAAAAQVSIVRNMLRAFLYSQPRVAEAVTELNRVLAENNLLTGFTTLFVGAYDSATRVLRYVNCGQEPALVRRADTDVIEPLAPTGPILGAIEGACYEEFSITLEIGDAVAIFTDGLTEVGASRTKMLGVEGVAALLAEPLVREGIPGAEQMAETLALRLVAGVDRFAQEGSRDDMCLLVGVVL